MGYELYLVIFAALGGGIGIYSAALALGIRHGIDWDHIAAITDITSSTAPVDEAKESWLIGEPGVMLTDQSHHLEHSHEGHTHEHETPPAATAPASRGGTAVATEQAHSHAGMSAVSIGVEHRQAILLGTLYALGHGLVVTILGLTAILAAEVLPDWIDPVMERIVGVTLIFLAVYLFYSIYRYFRSGGEFRLRSRWMLVFAGVANAWHWARSRLGEHEHKHVAPQQYGARTAFGIGLIHGIGAETGTQALIIATAVGATSKSVAIATLFVFVVGLLISNTFVTFASTVGFISARRRQAIYVAAGLVAAVFSLVIGVAFLTASTDILPGIDKYFRWIGGPET